MDSSGCYTWTYNICNAPLQLLQPNHSDRLNLDWSGNISSAIAQEFSLNKPYIRFA
ncbi:hypothetical protein ACN23B_01810 [Anabaena sp. FACHB-709]|uniref:Uncharacterized protein n=1 Tax=Anabaena cylindrica FACHB-318 TaxID=2692880 RepID=A0ABR7ZH73_ANACY|nr:MULTISPECIES: hypothetical protein [Nostocaceae]MBD2172017.1 hypothetical protein [Anabaena cylindrica FACHB-318]MBD2263792.1 hypothetical protein [Anabaena sp. FACHB-709]MBD2274992.1 hypothetical protein [Nostoc sp. PCC 7120 = FACHB-418]MBD2284888.1 hypothetical protein [Anabaena cylindrica FACHB-170]MBD2350626.1 hypothetical protein [Trichormus variabilis FACHB-171]